MTARLPRVATAHVVGASAVLAVVLALLSSHYGYHRDELYFRMLPPAEGYIDQPPLTPFLTRGAIMLFGDSVIAVRVVPLVCAVLSLWLLVLITREVGGARLAQALTAWGMAGATMTLLFGHVLLTASLDLVAWPAALLCVIRALRRDDGRWWVAAGVIIGLSSYNKLLVAVLVVALAVGLAVCGPWRWFRSGWLYVGVAVTGLLALPNLIYQATHGWPQFAMGAALAAENADDVRIMMWPFLVLLVGPVLAVFWVVAVITLLREPTRRPMRLLVPAFVVVVAFVFFAGSQFYYTLGMLGTLTAMGSVPVAAWARTQGRRTLVATLLAVNAIGCAVTSLPVLPVGLFGASGLAAVNSGSADQVGWPTYVEQISAVASSTDAQAIIASNYGEAGALDRFGSGLPPVYSGHNALGDLGYPDADVDRVVIVGGQADRLREQFDTCAVIDRLDNGVGVDNEEQGEPIMVCSGPRAPWSDLWQEFRHLS